MFRRSVVEISSRRFIRRIPRQITPQIPSFLYSRKEFSATSNQNASRGAGSGGKSSESGSYFSKFVIGSAAVGAAVMAAYQIGYLDKIIGKELDHSSGSVNTEVNYKEAKELQHLEEHASLPNGEEPSKLSQNVDHPEQKFEFQADLPHPKDLNEAGHENQFKSMSDVGPAEDTRHINEKNLPKYFEASTPSVHESTKPGLSSEGSLGIRSAEEKPSMEQNEEVQVTAMSTQDAQGEDLEAPRSLLDEYHLRDKTEESTATSSIGQDTDDYEHFSKEKEASVSAVANLNDVYVSKDGRLVLDFLQAIHAAEKRQSDLDARVFTEEKRAMKEKYEKELKDARARELMFAEEAAILDKELNRERTKAAAAIKSLQEKAEEKLRMELEQKESEVEIELKKVQELAKAELAAAIAGEKASQIEKMAEANLHINALCMAFYAQSEEARQHHSVHKLALGSLALEDALSKGLPIQKEIEALHTYLEGIDRDSLLDMVLSSLPEETRSHGTDTLLQLNQKFDALKGTLRHFSLIPPGGGGILAHSLAQIASWLKVKEDDHSGDGIESVINRVESYLADGKLAEAADALEEGVSGSQAAEIAVDWVRRARNRAITEQALTLLNSYATSISLS